MNFILRILITSVVAYFLTRFIPGVTFDQFSTALIFALVLSVLNIILKPFMQIFGFPLTVLTLGFFLLVINAVVVLVADYFIDGMHIDGFWWALVFSAALSIITSLLNGIFISSDKNS